VQQLASGPRSLSDASGLVQLASHSHGHQGGHEVQDIVYYMHIPRTAGTSFFRDANRVVWGLVMTSKEGCYGWKDRLDGVDRVATMVRNPRTHVLSQYLYCSEGPISWMTKVRGFQKWIKDWTGLQAQGTVVGDFSAGGHDQISTQKYVTFTSLPFKCYNPANLQSQHFTCKRPFKYPDKVDAELAVRNMQNTWFVGVAEAYQESLCLLHVKARGTLPAFCDCRDRTSWLAFNQTRSARHGERTKLSRNVSEQPEGVLRAVDALTAADGLLYDAAVRRFVRELREAERRFGRSILCAESPLARLPGPPA